MNWKSVLLITILVLASFAMMARANEVANEVAVECESGCDENGIVQSSKPNHPFAS
jgi:hypothetical protein